MLGWSQEQLASAGKVSRATVVDFERGARIPHPNNLAALRIALEEAGIEFFTEYHGVAGVKNRPNKRLYSPVIGPMSPRKLVYVSPDAQIFLGAMTAFKRPFHAKLASEIIARYSDIVYHFGGMAQTLLGSSAPERVSTILSAKSADEQRKQFQKVAKENLDDDAVQMRLFTLINAETDRMGALFRHPLAHWIWAWAQGCSTLLKSPAERWSGMRKRAILARTLM
jgi:hypothetical protein